MIVDWSHFTPWSSLAGGALIGVAAAILIVCNGRIAGVSGILGGLVSNGRSAEDSLWRLVFLAGLLLAAPIWQLAGALPTANIDASNPSLILAGLLVGIGARYASGCTSGHGVCGLSRGSPRSVVATVAFMAAGFAVIYFVRHPCAAAGA
jgi:uncharacterized membrane protein YedE/YeeE